MKIFGMSVKPDEITSVTIRRNGADITLSSAGQTSPKIDGFSRKVAPLTEGRVCKGGQNPPNISTDRPPAPGGSGGAS
mgnify:CR=1 FL=1